MYGFQWRHFGAKYVDMHTDYTGQGVDQLADVIHKIKTNPDDRRIILSAWNPPGRMLNITIQNKQIRDIYNLAKIKTSLPLSYIRFARDGFATLSRLRSILRMQWSIIMPIISKIRRYGRLAF